jgi:hypothetical protein
VKLILIKTTMPNIKKLSAQPGIDPGKNTCNRNRSWNQPGIDQPGIDPQILATLRPYY